jgi:hypothetical protein
MFGKSVRGSQACAIRVSVCFGAGTQRRCEPGMSVFVSEEDGSPSVAHGAPGEYNKVLPENDAS